MEGLPDSLGAADRRFLERLLARISADPRVAVLFLGGSHAAGMADRYSDLDLYLITTDHGFPSFRDGRDALMRGLGEPLFLEEHSLFGFLMVLFMYADGVHGEMALAPAKDLTDVHAGPHHVLLDREGLLAGRVFSEGGLDDAVRRDVLHRLLVWFWYDRRLLLAAVARGNLWTALLYLHQCRERCLDLERLRIRPNQWPSGHEKVERAVDPDVLATIPIDGCPPRWEGHRGRRGGAHRSVPDAGPATRPGPRRDLPRSRWSSR